MNKKNITVGEIIEQLELLERKRAVYDDVVMFLSQFISTDTHQPQKGIKSPIGSEEVIPEDIVELVRDEQQSRLEKLTTEINRLLKKPTQATKALAKSRRAPAKRRTNVKKKKKN